VLESLEVGSIIDGRYRLERRLGTGGFGTVWLASDADGTSVAVKVLHTAVSRHRRAADRFEREAKLLMELDHPNIARARAWGKDGDLAFVVLELLVGVTLDREIVERTRRGNRFSLDEIRGLLAGICAAIDHAHSSGVVHRDLKPKNAMIVRSEGRTQVKVLDFGVAKFMADSNDEETTMGRLLGSRFYMSPEQALGEAIDHRADVFALGTILFELLTLSRAWLRDEDDKPVSLLELRRVRAINTHLDVLLRITEGTRPIPSRLRPDLPPAVDAVVERALAIAPSDRFSSAGGLFEAFEDAVTRVEGEPTKASELILITDPGQSDGTIYLDDEFEEAHDTDPNPSPDPDPSPRPRPDPKPLAPLEARPREGERTALRVGRSPRRPTSRRRTPQRRPKPRPAIYALLLASCAVLAAALVLERTLPSASEAPSEIVAPAPPPSPAVLARSATSAEEVKPGRRMVEPPPVRKTSARASAVRLEMKSAPEPSNPYAALDELAARLRRDPSDLRTMDTLRARIIEAADHLPPGDLKVSLKRRATAGALVGDISALERCIDQLKRGR
jgi:serine/threonine protein kinase